MLTYLAPLPPPRVCAQRAALLLGDHRAPARAPHPRARRADPTAASQHQVGAPGGALGDSHRRQPLPRRRSLPSRARRWPHSNVREPKPQAAWGEAPPQTAGRVGSGSSTWLLRLQAAPGAALPLQRPHGGSWGPHRAFTLGTPILATLTLATPTLGTPTLGTLTLGTPTLGTLTPGTPTLGTPTLGALTVLQWPRRPVKRGLDQASLDHGRR